MDTALLFTSLAAAIVSSIVSFLIMRVRNNVLNEQLKQKEAQLLQIQSSNQQLQKEKEQLLSRIAIAETKLSNTQQMLEEAKINGDKLSEQLKLEMEALAERVMRNNSLQMVQRNEEKMVEILAPLKNDLGDFKKKVEETYEKESKERFSLGKEIDRLVKMSEQVSQEANNLSTALKGNSKMQGNWGEMKQCKDCLKEHLRLKSVPAGLP